MKTGDPQNVGSGSQALGAANKAAASICSRTVICLLTTVFLISVYRAWTLSITSDEALTFNWFVNRPLDTLFLHFDANHHILHTYLVKISVTLFGISEFTMRIPALLGSVLYLAMIYRVGRLILGDTAWFVLAAVLCTLNPLVFDFLVAARGYGLALAFSLWALYNSLFYSQLPAESGSRRSYLTRIGVGLALCVSCNLAFVFVCLGLLIAFAFEVLVEAYLRDGRQAVLREVKSLVRRLVLPGAFTFLILCAVPLSRAVPGNFYVGADSLNDTLQSILEYGLQSGPSLSFVAPFWTHIEDLTHYFQWLIVCALIAIAGWLMVVLLKLLNKQSISELSPVDRRCLVLAGTPVITIGLLILAHYLAHIKYPALRFAIFAVPFTVFPSVAFLQHFSAVPRYRIPVSIAAYLIVSIFAVTLAAQVKIDHLTEWQYDAGTKRIFSILDQRHKDSAPNSVKLGVSWISQASLTFYRAIKGSWMAPVTREGLYSRDYDYYVIAPRCDNLPSVLKTKHLRVLYSDPVSEAVLAVPDTP